MNLLDEGAHTVASELDSPQTDGAPGLPPTPPPSDVQVDDTSATFCYANFCRVTGTPEELILDFGLNSQPMGPTRIEVRQRVVLNYFTAKRLFQALGISVQRHETAFGLLETDVQKRITAVLRQPAAAD